MARNGDAEGGKQRVKWALRCNIAAIVGAVFGYTAAIAAVIGAIIYIQTNHASIR